MKDEKTNTIKYKANTKENAKRILQILEETYPDAMCSLDYVEPLHLVVALILAAQCTDERVNKTTPLVFTKYPDVYALSKAKQEELEEIIRPCGFYKNKASSIIGSAQILVEKFNGKVPDNMEDLCTLKGIGRKSSNIILQECFQKTVGIAVDTHVTRISRKMGFSNGNTQEQIEQELMKLLDKKHWNRINHLLVYHGRAICIARRPQCDQCPLKEICPQNE